MFSNPKPTFTPSHCSPFALCISPLHLLSASLPHFSSLIFLHAQLHDCYLLVVKLLLHCLSSMLLQPPPLPILCLSSLKCFESNLSSSLPFSLSLSLRSACSWPKCCGFVVLDSFSRFISQIMLLFNSFPAKIFGNCF